MKLVYFFAIIIFAWPAHAQLVDAIEDESKLYAQSKQVNQFFRRFNGEEDEKGNRYYPSDKQYRSAKLRKKYLATLFDEANSGMTTALKTEFAKQVLDKEGIAILDFHGLNWFSEVRALFNIKSSTGYTLHGIRERSLGL